MVPPYLYTISYVCVCYTLDLLESLLDVKKQRLLLSLQGMDSEDRSGGSAEREGKEESEGQEVEEEEEKGEAERALDDDELQGIRCRAPLEEVRLSLLHVYPSIDIIHGTG